MGDTIGADFVGKWCKQGRQGPEFAAFCRSAERFSVQCSKKYELFVIRYSILCSHKPTNITGDRMARLVQPHSELSHLLHQMQGALELASTEISHGRVMEKSWEKTSIIDLEWMDTNNKIM